MQEMLEMLNKQGPHEQLSQTTVSDHLDGYTVLRIKGVLTFDLVHLCIIVVFSSR